MKTIYCTPMTVAQYEASSMATKEHSFKKATKNFFKAAFRMLNEISLVYPQFLERQDRDLSRVCDKKN